MNREQLIRICLNSGVVRRDVAIKLIETIEANEREACAKACEDIYNDPNGNKGYDCYYTRPYLYAAEAIRARGQQ